jgi:hypothetical protein
MKRWLVWFGLGLSLFVVAGTMIPHSGTHNVSQAITFQMNHPASGAADALMLLFTAWFALTVVAVPVSIIRWLVKGRPS